MKISDINTEEYICKSLSCSGCAAELATRLAFKALGDRTVVVFPASCMSGTRLLAADSMSPAGIHQCLRRTGCNSTGIERRLQAPRVDGH